MAPSQTPEDSPKPDPAPIGGWPPPPESPPPRSRGPAAPRPRTPARRLMAIGAVFAAMLAPQMLIGTVVEERAARQQEVQREIGQSWGRPQSLLGPVLVLPTRTPVPAQDGTEPRWRRGAVAVLPTRLDAAMVLAPETRRRGLFEAVVTTVQARFEAGFELPQTLAVPDQPAAEILWREAYVMVGSNDLRLTEATPALRWDGRGFAPADSIAEPTLCGPADALRWPLGLTGAPEARSIPVALNLGLRATERVMLLPLAGRASVSMEGPWPTPSFIGADLPARAEVTEAGFRAEWSAGSRQGLLRRSLGACAQKLAETEAERGVGVALLEAVPTYRMVTRASKYAAFFLALAFVTYALFELTARTPIHLVQYGLLGCSIVLFPLLLLALGEVTGFALAFAAAAAAVTAQASLYTLSVTRRGGLAALFAAVLSVLFGFLYTVLSLEAFALLVGTLALFMVLSAVMLATRRVAWGGMATEPPTPA